MHIDLGHCPTVTSCKHTKVFSGEHLVFDDTPTLHGEPLVSWYWICSDCLEVGSEMRPVDKPPETQGTEYWRLMRAREPGCWIPNRYRN